MRGTEALSVTWRAPVETGAMSIILEPEPPSDSTMASAVLLRLPRHKHGNGTRKDKPPNDPLVSTNDVKESLDAPRGLTELYIINDIGRLTRQNHSPISAAYRKAVSNHFASSKKKAPAPKAIGTRADTVSSVAIGEAESSLSRRPAQ